MSVIDDEYCQITGWHFRNIARFGGAGCDLAHSDFYRMDLTGADFSGALLFDTTFMHVKMPGAKFTRAILNSSFLYDTDASGGDFSGAYCFDMLCTGGTLAGANFRGAHITRMVVGSTNIEGVDTTRAICHDIDGEDCA